MKITKFKVNGKDAVVANSALEGQVLPVPGEGDAGKVPTVQEDGSYALSNAGGSNAPLICTDTNGTLDKTMGEIQEAFLAGRAVLIHIDEALYLTVIRVTAVYFVKGSYQGEFSVDNHDVYYIYAVAESTEEAALAAYPSNIT